MILDRLRRWTRDSIRSPSASGGVTRRWAVESGVLYWKRCVVMEKSNEAPPIRDAIEHALKRLARLWRQGVGIFISQVVV